MKWQRALLLIVFAIAIGGAGYWITTRMSAANQPADTVELPPATVELTIVSAEATLQPHRDARLAFERGGAVTDVFVTAGDRVTAGAPLIQLDTTDETIAVERAAALQAQAAANLAAAEAALGVLQASQAVAAADLEAAQAELTLLQAPPTEGTRQLADARVAAAAAAVAQAESQVAVVNQAAPGGAIAAAEAALEAAETELFFAERDYEPLLQSEDTPDDVRREAVQALNAAREGVAAAQAALDAARRGATSGSRQAVAGGVTAAENQRAVAEAERDQQLEGPSAEQVAVLQSNIRLAERAVADLAPQIAQAEAAVEQAAAAQGEAAAALDQAESLLARRTLTAPFAGTIVDVLFEPGEVIPAGGPAIVLADLTAWHVVTVDLAERSARDVVPGLPVDITLDAFPGQPFSGVVSAISPIAAELQDDVTVVVEIDLNPATAPLRWGMTAFVRIDTEATP